MVKNTINIKGNLISLESPKVMGILNLTPDSFYDGGKYCSATSILKKVETMLLEQASFIDIGGYSSRPDSIHISEEEESRRLLPVIERIVKEFPKAILSVDTFRSAIASEAIDMGVHMVNDISGSQLDKEMLSVVASKGVPYIMMHMRGTPQTMQEKTSYEDITKEVCYYFSKKIYLAREFGISDIIIDPGFGFSKSLEQNYELLSKLSLLKRLVNLPLMVGVSRKSMIYKTLDISVEHALNGTTALHMASLMNGANILRVHDVKQAVETVKLYNQIRKYQ